MARRFAALARQQAYDFLEDNEFLLHEDTQKVDDMKEMARRMGTYSVRADQAALVARHAAHKHDVPAAQQASVEAYSWYRECSLHIDPTDD